MNDREKIEVLQFIATQHRTEFENRRKVEWRVVILCLTFYVVALAMKLRPGSEIPNISWLVVMLGFLSIALVTVIFSLHIHRAHAINKEFAERAENTIQDILTGGNPDYKNLFTKPDAADSIYTLIRHGKHGMYGWRFQSLMIFLLALLSTFLFIFY